MGFGNIEVRLNSLRGVPECNTDKARDKATYTFTDSECYIVLQERRSTTGLQQLLKKRVKLIVIVLIDEAKSDKLYS